MNNGALAINHTDSTTFNYESLCRLDHLLRCNET